MKILATKVPASCIERGPTSVAKHLLGTTSLGIFFQRPEVRHAIAEEALLARLEPFVAMPDLVTQEEKLVADWSERCPEQFAYALADADKVALSLGDISEEDRAFRRLVRLAAYRKIDVFQTGQETHIQVPELAGEPYTEVEIRGTIFQFGLVAHADYSSDAKSRQLSAEFQDLALVETLEREVFPMLAPNMTGPLWAKICRLWRGTRAFRLFEETLKLPAFPGRIVFPPMQTPPGYKLRWTDESTKRLGFSVADAVLIGLPMFISQPAVAWLQECASEVEASVKDRNLAVTHMVRWLTS